MYNILIGTPAYGGMVHTDFVQSILPLYDSGVKFTIAFIGNESLISRARNQIFSLFASLEYSQFTHLLFLDADIGMNAVDIIRLLSHDKPLIAAPVPLKGVTSTGGFIYNVGTLLEEESPGICSVDRVGTAVMCIRRDLALDVVKWAGKEGQIYYKKGMGQKKIAERNSFEGKIFNIFPVGIVDGEYLSEDFYFCKIVRDLGHKVYVDSTIKVRHNGNYVFG